jgi:hypothetical protein
MTQGCFGWGFHDLSPLSLLIRKFIRFQVSERAACR